jgi:pyruvate, water dikinase
MKADTVKLSTGLPGLDRVLQDLQPGDNVVWEVDGSEDYQPMVIPFREEAARRGRRLIYFRFARHPALLEPDGRTEVVELRAEEGFEVFVTQILDRIEAVKEGAYYVFDCLSDLAADWFSDRMLANFYQMVCPYVYELGTLAYFGLFKDRHPVKAVDSIKGTAQVVLEVFRKDGRVYVQPLKVFQRHAPTIYALHAWEGETFRPVTSSATITAIRAASPQPWLDFSIRRPGIWIETFHHAQHALQSISEGRAQSPENQSLFDRLLKMVVTRDERLLGLAGEYFGLADVVGIMKRMIGSGLIGGKSLGMLLARAILRRSDPRWTQRLEEHDSFFIGSDVFYTYLVENGCWWLCRRPRNLHHEDDPQRQTPQSSQAQARMLQGKFPEDIQEQFREMLEYFGQSPIIVRSSSLLEDSYGNAFSGKYESVFCANQGTPQERFEAFADAVRTVYASTMSPESLEYRVQRGLADRDEQMALLVQRVSGEMHDSLFFPHAAGVGFSYNPFVWHEDIDPEAGVLRLVFGLGTRAVDRSDDDYTRLVALNAPLKRPDSSSGQSQRYAQRRVDLLDLQANQLASREYPALASVLPTDLQTLFSREPHQPFLDFERLLTQTGFTALMRDLLRTLSQAYHHPVDTEFTVNFLEDGSFRVNLLQCRPFRVKMKGEARIQFPQEIHPSDCLIQSRGPILGHGLATAVDHLIYVPPKTYGKLSLSDRYSVARAIGRLTLECKPGAGGVLMLVGPGRWGTSMPALGVPVSFAEISRVAVLGEIALMHEGLIPDLSLGTHFFNDLVEMDMLYFGISPAKEGHMLNEALLESIPNRLPELLPSAQRLGGVIKVFEAADLAGEGRLYLNVDSNKQRLVCYRRT